jgi:hypothetical protein
VAPVCPVDPVAPVPPLDPVYPAGPTRAMFSFPPKKAVVEDKFNTTATYGLNVVTDIIWK